MQTCLATLEAVKCEQDVQSSKMVCQPYFVVLVHTLTRFIRPVLAGSHNAVCDRLQAGSKRVLNAKSDKFQGNIHKRGKVQDVSPVSRQVLFSCGAILCTHLHFAVQRNKSADWFWAANAEKQQQGCCWTHNAGLLPVCGCGVR